MPEQLRNGGPWLDGLDDLQVSFFLEQSQVRFADVAERLKGYEAIRVSEKRISGILRQPAPGVELHGHLRIALDDDDVDFEIGLFQGASSVAERGLGIDGILDLLGSVLNGATEDVQAYAIASFKFPSEEWQSTVPLPITLPGMLDSATGSPEVAGFEFAFRDENSDILRAAISIFTETKEYTLRLMYTVPLHPLAGLFDRAMSGAHQHLRLLIVPTNTTADQ